MRKLLVAALGVPLALILAASPVSAVSSVAASGSFATQVDPASITLARGPASTCVVTVEVTLTFYGTLVGTARGTATAFTFATCDEVAASPPGTFADVFRFVGSYEGIVADQSASGPLSYAGITRAGGAVTGFIALRGDSSASLVANAVVAVGGSYRGIASP